MTDNEILDVAKQCGATFECETLCVNGKDAHDLLITFANAIAQRTRDECAAVCEETLKQDGNWTPIGWKFSAAIRSMK